jgi:hypothetical protein
MIAKATLHSNDTAQQLLEYEMNPSVELLFLQNGS